MKEELRGLFFPKLCVCMKDNNSSPHGKFSRSSSKFPDLNFTSYVFYIYPCETHSEPWLHVVKVAVDPRGDSLVDLQTTFN